MEKSEILKRETDNLLDGVDNISERFRELEQDTLGTLSDEPLFFDNRSLDCVPLIANCTLSLQMLPRVTPPQAKIQRSRYENIQSRLEVLRVDFANLQDAVGEAVSGNVTSLATIANSIFGILTNLTFIKVECEKIKKVFIF
tara:strand:- start:292 stop:717 length:426 start_codon:yes stop_codon:yes gene_type:complete